MLNLLKAVSLFGFFLMDITITGERNTLPMAYIQKVFSAWPF